MMNSSTSLPAADPRPDPAKVRKFSYETVFSADGAILRDGSGFRTQFSREELEQARAEAFEEGCRARDVEVAEALGALTGSMDRLIDGFDKEARALRAEAIELALAAARVAADTALDAYGEARIVDAITQALETLRAGPRLVIRIAPGLVAGLKSRLEQAAKNAGFDGALIVRADPAVAIGDLALEWAEGAIVHDRAETFTRIQALMQGALDNPDLELIDE
jgi:flagellar assembly protein FliH